jgi:hypothetical protein
MTRMTESIQIVGVGARTPVGIRAAAAAAAVRAGIVAIGEHPFMLNRNGVPTPAAFDAEIDLTDMGPKRLLALAETALHILRNDTNICARCFDSLRLPPPCVNALFPFKPCESGPTIE